MRKTVWLLVLAVAACGDNKTTDDRGYTKAPLERPTVLVQKENAGAMDALGTPNGPDAPVIAAPDTTPTAAAKAAAPAPAAAAAAVPPGATAADVQAGQKIFTSTGNCFTCHGQTGTGTALAPPLNDAAWINIDGSYPAIQQLVSAGVPKPKQHPAPMPAKGGAALSDQEVKQVAAYVYSISRK